MEARTRRTMEKDSEDASKLADSPFIFTLITSTLPCNPTQAVLFPNARIGGDRQASLRFKAHPDPASASSAALTYAHTAYQPPLNISCQLGPLYQRKKDIGLG